MAHFGLKQPHRLQWEFRTKIYVTSGRMLALIYDRAKVRVGPLLVVL